MPMEWEKLLSPSRLGGRPAKVESGRSPFNSDHDKVIFSGAFRRLARKTQVHPLAMNDHVHNRLTHSLEVACVGRSLGIRVGEKLAAAGKLPTGIGSNDIGDIVQSTCLAHDIGNPPFGHTGEAAIRSWFEGDGAATLQRMKPDEANDLRTFEGNAQGLRVLTSGEYHPYEGGMRLTYATLASFIKYPWTSLPTASAQRPKRDKYGVFKSELDDFHEIAEAVGLLPMRGDNWYCRHPLVYLMEAADDFCYGMLDLEDGLEMGILSWSQVFDVLKPVLSASDISAVDPDLAKLGDGRKPPVVRGKVIDAYVEAAANAFIKSENELLEGGSSDGTLFDLVAKCGGKVAESVQAAKELARSKIFTHPRKIELEIGAYSVMATLLEVMSGAVLEYIANEAATSFKTRRVMDLLGTRTLHPQIKTHPSGHTPEYLAMMRVIDFISGCTDHYATYLSKQFRGMGEAR